MREEDDDAAPAGLCPPQRRELHFGAAGGRVHRAPLQRGIVAGGAARAAAVATAGCACDVQATLGWPLGNGGSGWTDALAAGAPTACAGSICCRSQLIMIHGTTCACCKPACVVAELQGRHCEAFWPFGASSW